MVRQVYYKESLTTVPYPSTSFEMKKAVEEHFNVFRLEKCLQSVATAFSPGNAESHRDSLALDIVIASAALSAPRSAHR